MGKQDRVEKATSEGHIIKQFTIVGKWNLILLREGELWDPGRNTTSESSYLVRRKRGYLYTNSL